MELTEGPCFLRAEGMAVMSASRKSKQRSNSDSARLLPLLVCRSSHLLGGPGLGMCREAKEFPYGFLILEYKPQMHSVAHKAHSPLSFTTNLHRPRISESHSGYPCLPFPMIAPQHFFSPPSNLVCCPRHLEFITRWLYLIHPSRPRSYSCARTGLAHTCPYQGQSLASP